MSGNEQQKSAFKQFQADLDAKIKSADASVLGKIIRVLNILSAAFLGAVGVLYFIFGSGGTNSTYTLPNLVCAAYLVLFALLIIAAELRIGKFVSFIAVNFGFMFSWFGRGVFLLFLGSLALGLSSIGIAAGIVTYIIIVFNTIVLCKNKDVTAKLGERDFVAPSSGDVAKAGGQLAKATGQFLAENPEYAHKAVNAAASNPEATGQIVGAVSGDKNAGKAAAYAASNPGLAHAAVDYGAAQP
eukprot:TRINITY_DN350_c0_g1_i1.p1 TRINITY_DN350_c0_g1~~TRINITY_DN350_c0_g1_i1.p1  ORF type:complete len:243 (+),score=93.84 TRINITY_DN350_c0_g1_i1:100-828(+)